LTKAVDKKQPLTLHWQYGGATNKPSALGLSCPEIG